MSSNSSVQTPPKPLSIAIPASFIDVYSSLAQKTAQIGRIARVAAINRVDEILVFPDTSSRKQAPQRRLVTRVLEYLDTPQYLRKHIFGKLPELRSVGLLPPLRTPHHPVEKRSRKLADNEIREGYAYCKDGKLVVDVGVEYSIPLLDPAPSHTPCRVTVSISRKTDGVLIARLTTPPNPEIYWGYKVIDLRKPLGDFLRHNRVYDLVIATSRKAWPISKVWQKLHSHWHCAKQILVIFGSHNEGLREIVLREGHQLEALTDFLVNTVPEQGVETIRVVEAVFLSLPVLRLLERL